jgi:organic hydroperoxide reductase OsmC/OhrA
MAKYRASLAWSLKDGDDFLAGRYGRGHSLTFGSGVAVPGTASHHIVGKWAAPDAVDPEEMFVASLSQCHMLTFLHKAREAGFTVTAYRDNAEGVMEKIDTAGRMAVTKVWLRPEIAYAGRAPSASEADHLHHAAHEECFIANSVKTEVAVEAPVAV